MPAPNPAFSLLLTDLYQHNMLEAYLQDRRTETAGAEFYPGLDVARADPTIERVVVTDAVPPLRLEGSDTVRKVEVAPCAPLLAEAVSRLATGAPLTDLLVY